MIAPDPSSSEALALSTTSAPFTTSLESGDVLYLYCADVASWLAQAATSPTASAASGSLYVPAGQTVILAGRGGAHVSAIAVTGTGTATLTRGQRL